MSNVAQKHPATMFYSKITDNIYLGSSMCCEEHEEKHGDLLAELGAYADIDLRNEYPEDTPHSVDVHMRLPVEDTYPPSPEQTKVGVDLMGSVVKMDKIVYVHCQVGHGRSPTLVIAYFILKEGMPADDAIAFVKKQRPEVHPTDRQLEFLKILEKSL